MSSIIFVDDNDEVDDLPEISTKILVKSLKLCVRILKSFNIYISDVM